MSEAFEQDINKLNTEKVDEVPQINNYPENERYSNPYIAAPQARQRNQAKLVSFLLLITVFTLAGIYGSKQFQKYKEVYSTPTKFKNTPSPIPTPNPGIKNDEQRINDMIKILKAIHTYDAKNNGELIQKIPTEFTCIGKAKECFNLSIYLVPTYFKEIPYDPTIGDELNTNYYFLADPESFQVTINAQGEIDPQITIIQ